MSKIELHDYQKTAVDFILDNPMCGLFLDMGLRQNCYISNRH